MSDALDHSAGPAALPPQPPPFILLQCGPRAADRHWLDGQLRRIGLEPESEPEPESTASGAAAWRIALRDAATILTMASAVVVADADPSNAEVALALDHDEPLTLMPPSCLVIRVPVTGPIAGGASDHHAASLREFLKLAVLVMDAAGASHIFWSPARLWTSASLFRAAIAEMLTSGLPPVMHLVAFCRVDDAAGDLVTTRGLGYFAGQELAAPLLPEMAMSWAVRRLARLAVDMILHGPVHHRRRVAGLMAGEYLWLEPGASGASPAGSAHPPGQVRVGWTRPG